MTENEAKEILNRIATRNVFCTLEEEPLKAFEMAENALEEIQQYRAIGLTPTMVQDTIKARDKAQKRAIENAHIVDEYREIGTIEEFAHSKRMLHIAELASDHIEKEKQEIRAKAIDEFSDQMKRLNEEGEISVAGWNRIVDNIAEKMKAGGKNE